MKKFLSAILIFFTITFASYIVDARNYEFETCFKCGGSGKCDHCSGKGYLEDYDSDVEEKCDYCNGSGNCQECGGTGEI